jgi:hypothetical protein
MKLHQKFLKLFLLIISLFLLSGMSVFIGANININTHDLDNYILPDNDTLSEPKSSWTNSYQDIRPNEDISNIGFITIPVGGALYEKIDEVSYNDADYIYADDTGYDCEVAMGNLNLVAGQTVIGIKVCTRGNILFSMGDLWQASIDWRIGTGSYSTADSIQFGTSWGWRGTSLWSGLSLSESQINNLRIRISIVGTPDTQILAISTMYAEITIRSNEAPTVDLTSPNGGEILQESTIITWTYEDPEGQSITFNLFYDFAGTEIWTPIILGLVNEISYEWDLSGFNQTQSQVRVRIEASDGYGENDEYISDEYFTILASHNLVVNLISPNGGEILQETTIITWTYEDPEGQSISFNLFYDLTGAEMWTPIVYGLVNETSYEWDLSGFTQTQAEVRVKVEVVDGNNGYDEDISNYSFVIYVKGEEGETIPSFYISIVGASICIIGVLLSINIIKRKRKKSTLV